MGCAVEHMECGWDRVSLDGQIQFASITGDRFLHAGNLNLLLDLWSRQQKTVVFDKRIR